VGASAYLVPDRYTSTAVLRLPTDSSAALIEKARSEDMRESVLMGLGLEQRAVMQRKRAPEQMARDLQIAPAGGTVVVQYTFRDRYLTQSVIRVLIERLRVAANGRLVVVDWPNLPEMPVGPNRMAIAGFGLAAGIALGAAAPRVRRRRPATA
jgi:hypothetical protein